MGYKYGNKSQTVRSGLHPDLVVLADELIGFRDVSLLEGLRSNERQAELLKLGRTQVGPGSSKHNPDKEGYARAVDAIPWPFHQDDWRDRDKFHLFAGYVLAVAEHLFAEGRMSMRLRWGGDWDKDWETSDNSFDDFPHFELIW